MNEARGCVDSPLLLQSAWWRRVKADGGWDTISVAPGVLQRQIGPIVLAYAPHAFGCADDAAAVTEDAGIAVDGHGSAGQPTRTVQQCVETLTATGREAGATLVRWDVPWDAERGAPGDALAAAGLRPAPIRVQPPDTVIVPLGGGEDAVLATMKSKTRYNVRVAVRKGVTVSAATGAAALTVLPEWYRLYEETARRDAITIHPLSYYRRVIEYAVTPGAPDGTGATSEAPHITLFTARHEDDLLGGIIVASWQGVSTYLYGASADVKRNLMGAYLLQWEAMRSAMAAGDHSYDLFGIPPTDDPAHPMHGLYRFKTGFGGRVLHRAGAWDLVLRPVPAALYRSAELLRGWYYYRVRKRIGRRA